MSEAEVIVNEQALTSVASSIRNYVASYRQVVENAVRSIKSNSSDWIDEDFFSLVSAINCILQDVVEMENVANQLIGRIEIKINQIHSLHNMKISL